MKKIWTSRRAEYLFLLLMLCAALFLFLCNLGNQYLWQDEAQTALISKTILNHGIPMGYDGKNFFSQELEAEYGENYIWKWHTWLPFYVLAGFFRLFGVNTFVARLPFALFGIGSVFLTYAFCKALWQNRGIAATAALLLLISVPFLLLSRQCRYYSMTVFFSLLSLYAYLGLLERKKHAYVTFVLSSVLLFHTHYIYCVTLLATVFLHVWLFHRDRLRTILLLAGIVVLINVPWIVWLSTMKYGQRYGDILFRIGKLIVYTGAYLLRINWYIFPPFLWLVVIFVAFGSWIRTGSLLPRDRLFWQRLSLLLFFVLFNLVTVVFASPWPYFRYLAPLVPILTIIVAMLVVSAARFHLVVAIGIVAALIYTGSMRDFLYEITHDYDGPVEGIVKYLNEHGCADDIALITYGDMPLKFYTNMRIIGGVTGEDPLTTEDPDWVIIRKHLGSTHVLRLSEYLETIQTAKYQRIVIDYPDITYENREEITDHRFRTAVNEDKVVIFRKIK